MRIHLDSRRLSIPAGAIAAIVLLCATVFAAEEQADAPQPIRHQITGLFSPDREGDLREAVKLLPDIELVSIDYKNAEAGFRYDSAKVFPNAKPEQIVERFDNMLRQASHHTFGVKPLRTTPREKLTLLEIPVAGLDCKGCCLGAYEAIYRIEGVEQATANFKVGLVTALVDPEKTNRAALETALKQRGVELRGP